MKLEEDHFLLGAASAVVAGSLVMFVARVGGATGEMLADPAAAVLGLGVAALGGGILARRVVGVGLIEAAGIAILLGVIVPMGVGAIIILPLAPIGALVAIEAWPVTIPAGFIWMVTARSLAGRRGRWDRILRAATALGLASTLMAVRYTQPAWVASSDGRRCLSFPNEYIGSIAWSPDGAWLGIGSRRDDTEGIVRLLDPRSDHIVELARGPGIDTDFSGVAVGPGGETAYLDEWHSPPGPMPGPTLSHVAVMVASPIDRPRRLAEVPTPAIENLTYTPDGITGVLAVDPANDFVEIGRLVWIEASATTLREVTPREALRHPVLAPMIRPDDKSIRIATPSGTRDVERPNSLPDVAVTPDGREILFALTVSVGEDVHDELIGVSTETGRRRVLAVESDAGDPQLAGGLLAYRTLLSTTNSVCIKPVAPVS